MSWTMVRIKQGLSNTKTSIDFELNGEEIKALQEGDKLWLSVPVAELKKINVKNYVFEVEIMPRSG